MLDFIILIWIIPDTLAIFMQSTQGIILIESLSLFSQSVSPHFLRIHWGSVTSQAFEGTRLSCPGRAEQSLHAFRYLRVLSPLILGVGRINERRLPGESEDRGCRNTNYYYYCMRMGNRCAGSKPRIHIKGSWGEGKLRGKLPPGHQPPPSSLRCQTLPLHPYLSLMWENPGEHIRVFFTILLSKL